tara:strand:- start:2509 stop:3486 length:978 start_codon:yes stop_codon:yes gene_type:complete
MKINKIAIITSGGDSPGMNAAIRSVVRSALYNNIECLGFYRGYQGIIEDDCTDLSLRSVSKILGQGGTFLKSARSLEFMQKEFRDKAYDNLIKSGVEALIVVGGNGSIAGAQVFSEEFNFPVIGIPASIDNDVYGTDNSIGFDTALGTIAEAIDKIRDTARSHNRLFFVEVMGRDCGNLALHASIASGACFVILPERKFQLVDLIKRLEEGKKLNKNSSIVVVAEGNTYGPSYKIAEELSRVYSDYEAKVTILGHLQRGGSPSSFDRVLASRMGMAAVEALKLKLFNKVVGVMKNEVVYTDFKQVVSKQKDIDSHLYRLNEIISR